MSRQNTKAYEKRRQEEKLKQQARRNRIIAIVAVVVVIIVVGIFLWQRSGEGEVELMDAPRTLSTVEPADRLDYYEAYPEQVIDSAQNYEAIIRTNQGDIRLRLFAESSPLTVNNFVFLANEGFYDGLTFHRVLEDFMAQGGDPTGLGFGGPGYQFADETENGLQFDRPGLLAMANSGPSTNGSQFFITFTETPHLNGLHTIFGEVIEGEEVLGLLQRVQPGEPGDVIERVDIVVG